MSLLDEKQLAMAAFKKKKTKKKPTTPNPADLQYTEQAVICNHQHNIAFILY